MQDTATWAKKIDPLFLEVNSDPKEYDRSQDLWSFGMFINPDLENIATSSAFPTVMSYEACKSNGRTGKWGSHGRDWDKQPWTQLEYMTWLIYEAVGWRKRHKYRELTIHVNYESDSDFLKDVDAEFFGPDVKTYLMLMMRQSRGHVTLKIYKEYRLKKTISAECHLKFKR